MFLHDNFFEQNGFSVLSSRMLTSSFDFASGIVEFLDNQDTLLSTVVYISRQNDADTFFRKNDVHVDLGALLLITDASGIPELPDKLSYFAFADPLPTVFNRLTRMADRPIMEENEKKFSLLWKRIIEDRNIKTTEILDSLGKISNTTAPFARICCVSFERSDKVQTAYSYVLKQLLPLIPNSVGTVYGQNLVILQTYQERKFDIDFDKAPINTILKKYNGYMMVGHGTRELSSLRVLYSVVSRTLEITLRLNELYEERVFHFERFAVYLVIDYCYNALRGTSGVNQLLSIAHPGVVLLTRYDNENKDNLRDGLYFYLMNGRSVSATADKLFLHRNTILNKVKKIQSLIDADFEDRHVRQRLIFSCQVMRYHEDMNVAYDDIPKL